MSFSDKSLMDEVEAAQRMTELKAEVAQFKQEMVDALAHYHVEYDVTFEETTQLAAEFRRLRESTERSLNKARTEILPHLSSVSRDQQTLSHQVTQLRSVQNTVDRMIELNRQLNALEKAIPSSSAADGSPCVGASGEVWTSVNWEHVMSHLCEVESLLHMPLEVDKDEVQVLTTMHNSYTLIKHTVGQQLELKWKKTVLYDLDQEAVLATGTTCYARLRILCSPSDLQQLIQSLEIVKQANWKLNKFGEILWKNFLAPAISGQSRRLQVTTGSQASHRALTSGQWQLALVEGPSVSGEPYAPLDLYSQLCDVLDKLSSDVLSLTITGQSDRVIDRIQNCFAGVLSEAIVRDCLSKTIPKNQAQLADYSAVIQATRELNQRLQHLGFLRADDVTLVDYVSNIDTLFKERKAQRILSEGREIVKRELFSTTLVDEKVPGSAQDSMEQVDKDLGRYLDLDNLAFPKCQVSSVAVDLFSLVVHVIGEGRALVEALEEHPNPATLQQTIHQLIDIIRKLFELYRIVVPLVHKDSIDTIPQVAALHYNNCMYLAHQCLFLGQTDLGWLSSGSVHGLDAVSSAARATLVDLVPELRRAGSDVFLTQMRKQRDLLLDCLGQAQGFQLAGSSASTRCRQAVRQCLHQLGTLGRVWRVLPEKVYFKAIGTQVNSVCEECVECVLRTEDIASDDCDALVTLLGELRDGCLALFQGTPVQPGESAGQVAQQLLEVTAERHVRSWPRMREVIFVLGSSLAGVEDRWAGGKGPLAEALQPSQVKTLIRALFQNTEKRAALIAKIR